MNKNNISRRQFLKFLAKGSAVGALGSIGQFSIIKDAFAETPNFSDYKALVCIFCDGGNDSFNMLVPTEAMAYSDYRSSREGIAVENTDLNLSSISSDLNNGTLGKGGENPYNVDLNQGSAYRKGFYDLSSKGIPLGVNAVMPELAQLITDNKATIIANTGTLIEPVTRSKILDNTANLPVFLFAHDHQRRLLETGQAEKLAHTGWAGGIADDWLQINNKSSFGLNISYIGNNYMMKGASTSPMILKNTPVGYRLMSEGVSGNDDVRRGIFKALSGIPPEASATSLRFNTEEYTNKKAFKRYYGDLLDKSMQSSDVLVNTWNDNPITYTSKGPYGEDLFGQLSSDDLGFTNGSDSQFFQDLESVAKMIDLGSRDAFATGKYNRQIFIVNLNGFDTHGGQTGEHPKLLRELSMGLWKFQKALEELGHEDKVMSFTMSDFGRTLRSNGRGTDHGWGSHQLVIGGSGSNVSGSLNGGAMIGELPDFTTGGPDDHDKHGRIIPKISQDQVNASLCKWFGVDETLITKVFPNLKNFEKISGVAESALLSDLFIA